jgi:hypothetical protein
VKVEIEVVVEYDVESVVKVVVEEEVKVIVRVVVSVVAVVIVSEVAEVVNVDGEVDSEEVKVEIGCLEVVVKVIEVVENE